MEHNMENNQMPDMAEVIVAVDTDGNEVKVRELPDGALQDAEFSNDPQGN